MQAPPPGRPPTNARGRRTRTALLAAARAVLEEHGFPHLTMAAVAARAGVTRRAVCLHFGSRGDLVGALFDYVAETKGLQASLHQVRSAPNGVAALDAWARHEATYPARIGGIARALEHVGRDDPDAATWRRRIAQHQLADCRRLAERLAHEHRLAPGWTVASATDMLWALISTEPLERIQLPSSDESAGFHDSLLRPTFWLARRHGPPRVG